MLTPARLLRALWSVPLLALSALVATPPLSLQVDGRAGWVVTDDKAPRLSWTPGVAMPGLQGWQFRVERTDGARELREWQVPADRGPWQILDGLSLASRARYSWQVTPVYANGSQANVSSQSSTPC